MGFHSDRQRKGFFARLGGIKGKLERAQEKRILSKTKKEEMKLAKKEKTLSKRLKFEIAKQKRLSRVKEEKLALEKIKAREKATEAEIKKFTVAGKIERGVGKGARFVGERARTGAEKFAEERRKRKEFLRTPEGRREIKAARIRREKFLKKLGKIKLV